eukprot:gene6352-biopygen10403
MTYWADATSEPDVRFNSLGHLGPSTPGTLQTRPQSSSKGGSSRGGADHTVMNRHNIPILHSGGGPSTGRRCIHWISPYSTAAVPAPAAAAAAAPDAAPASPSPGETPWGSLYGKNEVFAGSQIVA